jgi:CYTH domain-containing protein
MGREIERKFLVAPRDWENIADGIAIRQGYLPTADNRVVRARIAGDAAFLTIKGPDGTEGRLEYEYTIPPSDAEEILVLLCEKPIIEKTRYRIEFRGLVWEVDVFHSDNEGLVVAEVELQSADQQVPLPPWVTEEVTGNPKYSNASLVKNPYARWRGESEG